MSKFKIGDRVTHALVPYSEGTVVTEERINVHGGSNVSVDFDTYAHGDGKNKSAHTSFLTRVPKFKVGDRIEHNYGGPGTVVEGEYKEDSFGELCVPVKYDRTGDTHNGNYERMMKMLPQPSITEAFFGPSNLPKWEGCSLGSFGRVAIYPPFRYRKFEAAPSNKLTAENKDSEEQSTFHSATDGRIQLSFKGRHLLQRLRSATYAAIQFQNWHVFGDALSRARAAIAFRMGELESRLAGAEQSLKSKQNLSNLLRQVSSRRYARIQELEATVTANEQFIELQRDRLQKLRDRTDNTTRKIREALDVFEPETDGKSFDP